MTPIQAFVLRCPECGAPQPGPESICRFCKVPLMWAPARSLSRDDVRALGDEDGVEDVPGTKLITFGPTSVRAGEVFTFEHVARQVLRPTHLWLDPRSAQAFFVESLHIGDDEVLALDAKARMAGSLFARGRGWPLDPSTIMPGIVSRLVVRNSIASPHMLMGAFRVLTLSENHLPSRSPWGPQIIGGRRGPQIVGGRR